MNTIDITVQGIPCVFDKDALDDFEVLDKLAQLKDEDVTVVPYIGRAIFGDEQLSNIMSQLRDVDGRIRSSVMVPFIMQSLDEASKQVRVEAKNS